MTQRRPIPTAATAPRAGLCALHAAVMLGALLSAVATPAGAQALLAAETDTVAVARLSFGAGPSQDGSGGWVAQTGTTATEPGAAPAATAPPSPAYGEWVPPQKNFGRAAVEATLVNVIVWSYNRYIREGGGAGFKIGFNSWEENILNGFEWDDNNFDTNQFAHPYHGSLYFNAARANGYDFYESIPFAFMGSFMWEYFGEEHHGAMNDWVNTSVGGVALGEILFRLSTSVLDNTATGSGRTWREIGGFALSPVHGFNRLVTGEMFRQGPNPPGRKPENAALLLLFGGRTFAENNEWDIDSTRTFAVIGGTYGRLFSERKERKPYDYFDAEAQVNFGDKTALGRLQARGLLWSTDVARNDRTWHRLGVFQNFDYINRFDYEFGAQSLSVGITSALMGEHSTFTAGVLFNGVILGATDDDYENFTGRAYDFGPGLGFRFYGSYLRNGRPIALLRHDHFWIDTLNGTPSDHYITITRAEAQVPLNRTLGAGVGYQLYTADRNYKDYPDVYKRSPEFRAYLAWDLN